MRQSKRIVRRAILSNLFDYVRAQYDVDLDRTEVVAGRLTFPQLDALLAFRSDPRLDEIRSALVRLDTGTYGVCGRCKGPIPRAALHADPTARYCQACEQALVQPVIARLEVHVPQIG